MSDLAVIIVSWNVRELLTCCLRSLLADVERVGIEAQVWVVDNASTDGTPEVVARMFPAVHLIVSQANLGFGRGNNLVWREIRSSQPQIPKYVWLLNPDTEVQPGATEALKAALEIHPRAGVVGPKLLHPDGSLQHSAFRFPGLVQLVFDLFPLPSRLYDTPLNGRYPRRLYEGGAPFPVDHPLGASMMARSEVIADVGLLDEEFWMYCEEVDWCWRMREAGWRAYCAPAARVIHHVGQSSKQSRVSSFINLWTSRARLYARHHGPLKRRLAQMLVRIGMQRRMRGATPAMVTACRHIVRVWEEIA
ncbi:MAG: glycosyltransferase family 2 protein [Chloroflexi bacterium]|nr:MAG: glycosyltransferase family 2 protein [Chloroflexota bacterium]